MGILNIIGQLVITVHLDFLRLLKKMWSEEGILIVSLFLTLDPISFKFSANSVMFHNEQNVSIL